MSRVLLLLLALLAPLAGVAGPAPAIAGGTANATVAAAPGDAVQAFHNALLASMKSGKTASCDSRTAQLATAIDQTFDLPFIAQHVLRRHWDGLSEAQRGEFIATFRDLVVSTYAQNFSSYGGEVFTAPVTQDAAAGGAQFSTVTTKLKPTDGDAVTFEYQLHNSGNGWRIVNIIADGVSDLALRTVQYDRAFQDQGFDGLLKQLRDQTAKNKVGC